MDQYTGCHSSLEKKIIRVYSNKRLISAKMLVWEGGDAGLIRRWLLSSTFDES